MAASLVDRVMDAVVAVLEADSVTAYGTTFTKPEGFVAERYRLTTLEQDEGPIGVVFPGGDRMTAYTMQPDRMECELTWRVLIRTTGEPPDQALDPYRTWVIQAIHSDTTLGGLARTTEYRSTGWQDADANVPIAGAFVEFATTYRTKFTDPTTVMP